MTLNPLSPKPLPTPPEKKPLPAPPIKKSLDSKIQEKVEVKMERTPSSKSVKASVGKHFEKLQKKAEKFFKGDSQKVLSFDPRLKLDLMQKNIGVHPNLSLKEAKAILVEHEYQHPNTALIRSENGNIYITRMNRLRDGNVISDDKINNTEFTKEQVDTLNRYFGKKSSGYEWISPPS